MSPKRAWQMDVDSAPPSRWWPIATVVGAVAFVVRLSMGLTRSSLFHLDHDQSVYYTAAVGLSHGILPYRDFLILHPPGIAIILTPFAWIGAWVGDFSATVASQVAFMALGAVSAMLVSWSLRGVGWVGSLIGGLVYAVALPSVYAESSIWLEAPGSFFLILGMALVVTAPKDRPLSKRRALIAGLSLGLSPTFKIWTIVPSLMVVGWLLLSRRSRSAAWVVAGAAAALVLVMLPFFLAAPTSMWQMVVTDQLGRPIRRASLPLRLWTILGFRLNEDATWSLTLTCFVALALAASIVALGSQIGRFAVLMLIATLLVAFTSPTWFNHYATLVTGPLAMIVGVAVATVLSLLRRPRWLPPAAVALIAALLVGYTQAVVLYDRQPEAFDASALGSAAENRGGCITSNEPIALLNNGLLRRNIARGCLVMADFRGYYYHLRVPGQPLQSRLKSPQYQQFVIEYLGSGSLAVVIEEGEGSFDPETLQQIHSWPVVLSLGEDTVRDPTR